MNGKNYGWRCYEGTHSYNLAGCDYPEYVDPIYEYPHNPECSITGGYVYRGINVPELEGKYIYGDYCSSKIWALSYDGVNPPTNELLVTAAGPVTSFGVDQNDEIYVTSSNGKIYRFTPTVTSVKPDINLNDYILEQNYPNPFNPATVISYNIPEESNVVIKIYNSLGKQIDTIASGLKQKGFYQTKWNAGKFASGIYYAKMTAESTASDKVYSRSIKMLYLK